MSVKKSVDTWRSMGLRRYIFVKRQVLLNLALSGKRRLTFEEYEHICWALGVGVETFLEARPPQAG